MGPRLGSYLRLVAAATFTRVGPPDSEAVGNAVVGRPQPWHPTKQTCITENKHIHSHGERKWTAPGQSGKGCRVPDTERTFTTCVLSAGGMCYTDRTAMSHMLSNNGRHSAHGRTACIYSWWGTADRWIGGSGGCLEPRGGFLWGAAGCWILCSGGLLDHQ